VPQPSIKTERAAVAAATSSGNLGDGLLAGLLTYVGEADGEKIAEAWGKLPTSALNAVIGEMREHFGAPSA
jgi:hypothetical protein